MVHMDYSRSPFGLLERFWETLDRDWPASRMSLMGSEFPPINLSSDENGAVLTAELPGMDEKDIELSLEGDMLTIRGKRTASVPEGARVLRRERHDYDFTRSVRLPFAADTERGDAKYENGVLTVHIFRREADKPRRIAIENK